MHVDFWQKIYPTLKISVAPIFTLKVYKIGKSILISVHMTNECKGPFKHYVIMFLTFLGPPTSLMICSTVNHQKISDPTHPSL